MHHHLAEISAPVMPGKPLEAGESVRQSPVLRNLLAMAVAADSSAYRRPGPSRAARSIIKARSARRRFFDGELFADPAWDMLLELYALEGEGRRISVSKLSLAAGVPCTTALRWLDKLEAESLLVREEDPSDGRRVWIMLSPNGIAAMDSYFRQIATDPSA
jgi:DNA-binding MarR family transcriptional regulator